MPTAINPLRDIPQRALFVIQLSKQAFEMNPKMITLLCIIALNGCAGHQEQSEMNSRHTPAEARRYVNWWAENIRPSQRPVFERALSGEHAALRSILNDTDNSYGPPDQNGYPSSVLAGAFILAIGDEAFADFIRNEPPAVRSSVYDGFIYGPWSFTETEFARMFPRTAQLRDQFYASRAERAEATL